MNNQFKYIQTRLQVERQHLTEELMSQVSQSANDGHAGSPFAWREETATESFELETRVALALRIRERLTDVEHALNKLGKGTYGLCDSCGKPIPRARLEAIPQANLCLGCKSLQQKKRLYRPVAV